MKKLLLALAMCVSACGNEPSGLPSADWKAMGNPETFADNYESRKIGSSELYPQVVTLYKMPMLDKDKSGKPLSDGVFLDCFDRRDEGAVTCHVRYDAGTQWFLSRQTFKLAASDVRNVNDYASVAYADEINRTVFLLSRIKPK